MERWQKNLQLALAGVVVAALLEAVMGPRRKRIESMGRCLLAGGVAFAYAQLTPTEHWGARSGAAFAQLPVVVSLESNFGGVRPLEMAAWGGLTGALLRAMR